MPTLECQQCETRLKVPEEADGRVIQCPKCDLVFTIRLHPDEENEPAAREANDDPPRRAREDDWESYARRPLRRKKKKKFSGVPWQVTAAGITLGAGLLLGLLIWAIVSLTSSDISDSEWQPTVEVDRFKVEMPGAARRSDNERLGGFSCTLYAWERDRKLFFVAYSNGYLTNARSKLPAETLLNDYCRDAVSAMGQSNPVEEKRRESIQLGQFPGKQIVVELREKKVVMIMRVYLVGTRFYIAYVGGKGYETNHRNVTRFFDSLEITEKPGNAPNSSPPNGNPSPSPRENRGPTNPSEKKAPPTSTKKPADVKLAKPGALVYLSDMSQFDWKPGATGWIFGNNGSLGSMATPEQKVSVKGEAKAKALCMHPASSGYTRICYSLGQKASKLKGSVAISEDAINRIPNPTRFLIMGDGQLIWKSDWIADLGDVQAFEFDIANVNILELRVSIQSSFNGSTSHAVWIDPQVKVKE